MKIARRNNLLRTAVSALLLLAGLSSPGPGRPADEVLPLSEQHPGRADCLCRVGNQEGADPLRRLLSAAIRARGGLAALENRQDEYSVTRVVYHDVYTTEFLHRTWTKKPYCFRQDTVQDGVILKSQQYDGKDFIEAYGRRTRFGLEKDLKTLLENLELNRIFSLLCIDTESYPAALGGRVLQDGRPLQEVLVRAPSGLTYHVFFDEETCLVAKMEYTERSQYGESEEVDSIVTTIDSYRAVDGVLVADRFRIFSRGTLKAEVHLVEDKANTGMEAGFFSIDRLKRDLAASAPERRMAPGVGTLEEEWKEAAYHKIAERLETHRNCRFREVASYGDPERYRKRLFESGLSLLADPTYLVEDDVLAFYADLLPAPAGFYEDCIVLGASPDSPSVSAGLLLHETTHAILRRGQEEAPLKIADDEFLAYYQGSLFGVGNLLEAFERIAFDKKAATEGSQKSGRAAHLWRAAERNLRQTLKDDRITPEALEQFRKWCGVDFDLHRIRRHYLELGADPAWLPMDPGSP